MTWCTDRAGSDRILLKKALGRYLREVSSTKCESTAYAEKHKAKALKAKLERLCRYISLQGYRVLRRLGTIASAPGRPYLKSGC